MRSLRMTIAYDGTNFGGWQRQPKRRTVQAELEQAMERVTGQKTLITASGRTDAGVHALAQVVGFQTATWLENEALRRALNAELPADVFVFEIVEAPDDFDPIRDAVRKRYRYVIQDGQIPDIFGRNYSWRVFEKLDVAAMHAASRALLGEHDFAAYQTNGSSRLTTVRTIYDILVERRWGPNTERVEIEVEANGFLFNMVRNIVGTLTQVGRGKRPIEWPVEVLESKLRINAGMNAPAQGLYMMWVRYEI